MSTRDKFYRYDNLTTCSSCGGQLDYAGLGEYVCSECGSREYNDYGKVRNFLEKNPGANQEDVLRATGVSRNSIRLMLLEDKLEIAPNSITYLRCMQCGAPIRSGRYCDACQARLEAIPKSVRPKPAIKGGYAFSDQTVEDGKRRFERERDKK